MIADSTRLLLTGSIAPLAQRVVTWAEFRAVHSVTFSAEELAEMAAELTTAAGVVAYRILHIHTARTTLVTVRRAHGSER